MGIESSGPDAILGEIGGVIEEFISSHEITIENKNYKVNSIYDLCGHNIGQYLIHLNKAVPNIKIDYPVRMEDGEVFAIETFPTIGCGKIYETEICNHYMIDKTINLKKSSNLNNNKILEIYKIRKTLAFCPRWFDFEIPKSNILINFQ